MNLTVVCSVSGCTFHTADSNFVKIEASKTQLECDVMCYFKKNHNMLKLREYKNCIISNLYFENMLGQSHGYHSVVMAAALSYVFRYWHHMLLRKSAYDSGSMVPSQMCRLSMMPCGELHLTVELITTKMVPLLLYQEHNILSMILCIWIIYSLFATQSYRRILSISFFFFF